ncbi:MULTISPECIES: DUF2761 domain-containing protein [Halocynthiibacter]|uniref:DUF2761 domain-containing protein n=1 Tax=Halocynthiibacter halioticoli TaxID=2986804 RepID=A0AAE3J333_9RHOB|nr:MULTISPECIES: DUF2761 domain-containing protein [Halocynthiibacter]MCV6826025.1 DUF2761 domain-containing protein [Halocynthiibacter halioticoli]MCW4059026.1 DUF2761 domain-containing protein [Halocynthiibacter sp. SDUM655004]
MPNIEIIPHEKTRYPSGVEAYIDSVHSLASRTGRQEVTLAGAVEAQYHGNLYAYLTKSGELGLDPWRYLEGVDPYINNDRFDVWFENCPNPITVTKEDTKGIRLFVDSALLAVLAEAAQ